MLYNLARATTSSGQPLAAHTRLAEAFPLQVRELLEWGLTHPDKIIATTRLNGRHSHLRFIIGALGKLGTAATTARLTPWVADPDLGDEAAQAIRRLRHGDR